MFPYDRLKMVLVLTAIGLFCSSTLSLPARDVSLPGLAFTLSGRTLLGLILLGLVCTGMEAIVRGHPGVQTQPSYFSILHWILPAMLTIVAWALLSRVASIQDRAIGAVAAGAALALLITAEYYSIGFAGRGRVVVRFSLHLVGYLLATLLYAVIGLNMPTGLPTTLTVAAVSAPLALRLICDDQCPVQRVWPYALGLGALSGLIAWMLNFWVATPLLRSLALVVSLYVLVGLARHYLLGRLTRRVVVEYLLVGLAALLLLFAYTR